MYYVGKRLSEEAIREPWRNGGAGGGNDMLHNATLEDQKSKSQIVVPRRRRNSIVGETIPDYVPDVPPIPDYGPPIPDFVPDVPPPAGP